MADNSKFGEKLLFLVGNLKNMFFSSIGKLNFDVWRILSYIEWYGLHLGILYDYIYKMSIWIWKKDFFKSIFLISRSNLPDLFMTYGL